MKDVGENLQSGHRARLRGKFLAGKLAGYELLELLLSYAVLRRDVKPVAKALIKKFGNVHKVLTAGVPDLCECFGLGESSAVLISLVRELMLCSYRGDMREMPLFHNVQRLYDYCRLQLMGKRAEEFHVLYLDGARRLIEDDAHSVGTMDNVAVYPREVLKKALDLNAKFVALYHNHPDGNRNFSAADMEITMEIKKILDGVNVEVIDHLLLADDLVFSAKNMFLYK